MTPRLAGNDQRTKEVVKYLTATFEYVGRALYALEQDNWDSARDHMSNISSSAAITNVCLNVGSPDAKHTLAAVREQLSKQWADAIAAFLAGAAAPPVQESPTPLPPGRSHTDGDT